jgi:predicted protein tyrosine phosphatase
MFENVANDEALREHPFWSRYVFLYEKLHRLAVRKTFKAGLSHRILAQTSVRFEKSNTTTEV